MKTKLLIFLLLPFLVFSQTQIGNDIDNGRPEDQFGKEVILSSDGTIAAIKFGFPFNSINTYKNINNVWTQMGQTIHTNEVYSYAGFSLSADGGTIAVSHQTKTLNSTYLGHVNVFKNINNVWTQIGQTIDAEIENDDFGDSVSLSHDGNIVAIGSTGVLDEYYNSTGSVQVFKNENGNWVQLGQVLYGDAQIRSKLKLSLSSDGSTLAVGNSRGIDGSYASVKIYKLEDNIWSQLGDNIIGDNLNGFSKLIDFDLSFDGKSVAIALDDHVQIYKNVDKNWIQIGGNVDTKLFGATTACIDLSLDGNVFAFKVYDTIYIGPHGKDYTTKVIVFQISNNTLTLVGQIKGYDDLEVYINKSISLSSNGSILANGVLTTSGYYPDNDDGVVRVYDLSAILLSTESFNYNYFSYYPNPVKDILNINLNSGLTLKQVNIYNIQSQYLYSVKTSKIDVSNLASGMYFIEVETNEGKSAKKIIIE